MSSPTLPASVGAPQAWARLERWLADSLPTLAADLAPGIADADLDALAQHTGLTLPDALQAIYRRHDGQRNPVPGLFFGLRFLPAREAGEEWGRWTDLLQDDPALTADVAVDSHPEGAVQPVYFSDAWLPFASDGAGNGLAVDLAPGARGTVGQVITFGADEPTRVVLSPSAAHFVGWCAQTCESGGAAVVSDPGAPGGQALLLAGGRNLLDAMPALFGPG